MESKTSSHWVRIDKEIATVGLTRYAQQQLGEIVHIELPHVGDSIQADEEVAVIESTKAAIDLYSPLSGEIIEVNAELTERPHAINEDPDSTWLFRIRL